MKLLKSCTVFLMPVLCILIIIAMFMNFLFQFLYDSCNCVIMPLVKMLIQLSNYKDEITLTIFVKFIVQN